MVFHASSLQTNKETNKQGNVIFTVTSISIDFVCVKIVMGENVVVDRGNTINFIYFQPAKLGVYIRDLSFSSLASGFSTLPPADHKEVNPHLRVIVMFRPSNYPN